MRWFLRCSLLLAVMPLLAAPARPADPVPSSLDEFKAAVQVHDEVMECHMVAGGFDYLL